MRVTAVGAAARTPGCASITSRSARAGWCAPPKGRPIRAFSTVCPHLGCGIDFDEKSRQVQLPLPRVVVRPRRALPVGPVAARPRRAGGAAPTAGRCWSATSASAPEPRRKSRSDERGPRRPAAAAQPRRGGLAPRRQAGAGSRSASAWPSSSRRSWAGTMPGGASLWHTLGSVAAGLVRARGGDRHLPVALLRPVGADRLGVGRVHPGPADARLVRARPAQLRLVGADRRRRRCTSCRCCCSAPTAAARAELDDRPRPVRRVACCSRCPGYLLPWDQKGYWAKLVEATITGSAPVVGGAAQQVDAGRHRVRQPDRHPRLRGARAGAAGRVRGAGGAAHLSVSHARPDAEVVALRRGDRGARRPGLAVPVGAQRRRSGCFVRLVVVCR